MSPLIILHAYAGRQFVASHGESILREQGNLADTSPSSCEVVVKPHERCGLNSDGRSEIGAR
eukprot:scaffold60985_cov39-Tisochrysis_lutea.AAC.3